MLCRDRCGYCTFAKPPARLDAAVPAARRRAGDRPRTARRWAATRRCSRSARRPRTATPPPREWLADARLRVDGRLPRRAPRAPCSTRPGLLPHANAGALDRERARAAPGGQPVAGDDDRDARGPPRRARRPAPRRARQDARAAARDARGRRPRRASRSPPGSSSASARRAPSASTRSCAIARAPRAPRSRAGGDRPELPAQAGHRDAHAPTVRARRVPLDDRRGPPRARRRRCTSRRRRT